MGTRKKSVRLIVNKDWTTVTISTLGSGFFYHLSYPVEGIDPELIADIRKAHLHRERKWRFSFGKTVNCAAWLAN